MCVYVHPEGLNVAHSQLPEAALALRRFYVDLLAYMFTHPNYLLIDGMRVTDLLENMQTEAQQKQYLHDVAVSAPGGYLGCDDLAILSSELNVDIIVVLEAHPPNPASRNVVSSMHPSVRP